MLVERVIGVFRLDVNVFEEIEHDPNATVQAALVVTAIAFLNAIGNAIGAAFGSGSVIGNFFGAIFWAYVGWFLWSSVTYWVGTSIFRGTATLDEMLRVIGFAEAPQVLGIIPCIGPIIGLIWSLIAGFIAVRQGLDLDDTNACLTIIVGFFIYAAGFVILAIFVGGTFALF